MKTFTIIAVFIFAIFGIVFLFYGIPILDSSITINEIEGEQRSSVIMFSKTTGEVEDYFFQGKELNNLRLASRNEGPFSENPHTLNAEELRTYNASDENLTGAGVAKYLITDRRTKEVILYIFRFKNQNALNYFLSTKRKASIRPDKPIAINDVTLVSFELGKDEWWNTFHNWSSKQRHAIIDVFFEYQDRTGLEISFYKDKNKQQKFVNWMRQLRNSN